MLPALNLGFGTATVPDAGFRARLSEFFLYKTGMTNTILAVSLWLLDEVTRLSTSHRRGVFVKSHFLSSRGIRSPHKPRDQHIWSFGILPSPKEGADPRAYFFCFLSLFLEKEGCASQLPCRWLHVGCPDAPRRAVSGLWSPGQLESQLVGGACQGFLSAPGDLPRSQRVGGERRA